jgi:hypothetical protein
MNDWNRVEAKRWFRENEIRILRDQWFQQDLREAEMKTQLGKLPLLPNLRNKPLFENGPALQNRQRIQLNLDLRQMEAERKATEFKRKMRNQQIENLQRLWLEQDMCEAKAKAEAEKFFLDLGD